MLTPVVKRSAKTCTMSNESETAEDKSHVSNAQSTDSDPATNITSGKSQLGTLAVCRTEVMDLCARRYCAARYRCFKILRQRTRRTRPMS